MYYLLLLRPYGNLDFVLCCHGNNESQSRNLTLQSVVKVFAKEYLKRIQQFTTTYPWPHGVLGACYERLYSKPLVWELWRYCV